VLHGLCRVEYLVGMDYRVCGQPVSILFSRTSYFLVPFRQQGVRILTVYLYLNDVEAGGGTNFDQLDITVMPKRGRALLWPSVLDRAPSDKDGRTTHQALPVEAGVKYGANGM
jgi:hypothetical protein